MPWLKLNNHTSVSNAMRTRKKLTKINEASMYKPNVASNESTIFLKTGLVNTSPNVNGPSSATASTPLNANKNAAAYARKKSWNHTHWTQHSNAPSYK